MFTERQRVWQVLGCFVILALCFGLAFWFWIPKYSFNRYVFPAGFKGAARIVVRPGASPLVRSGGVTIVRFDREGQAFVNQEDFDHLCGWSSNSYEYSDGKVINPYIPNAGDVRSGRWIELKGLQRGLGPEDKDLAPEQMTMIVGEN